MNLLNYYYMKSPLKKKYIVMNIRSTVKMLIIPLINSLISKFQHIIFKKWTVRTKISNNNMFAKLPA